MAKFLHICVTECVLEGFEHQMPWFEISMFKF